MNRELFLERLSDLMESRGFSKHHLSKLIGANGGYVRDVMDPKKNTTPGGARMAALARELLTTVEYLTGQTDNPEQIRSDVVVGEQGLKGFQESRSPFNHGGQAQPGIPLVGTGDCADIQVETESGELVDIDRSSFDPSHTVRMITRPPALQGARDLYAIYFQGESMLPRYEPGEVGIVDPARPVKPGDYVLVQLNDGASEEVTSVLAKRLVRQSAKSIRLEQFNPAVVFEVPRARVSRVHRILQQTDMLFG